jgi:DNA-binding response OmpR family regulator
MTEAVMIVDDEANMRFVMGAVLERAGFSVLKAGSGAEALDLAQAHEPRVVILDEMMPGMSGSKTCRKLKALSTLRHIAVIMHSAGMEIRQPDYLDRNGADAAFTKPCQPGELIAAINRFLTEMM